jgi:hypothetical protein
MTLLEIYLGRSFRNIAVFGDYPASYLFDAESLGPLKKFSSGLTIQKSIVPVSGAGGVTVVVEEVRGAVDSTRARLCAGDRYQKHTFCRVGTNR